MTDRQLWQPGPGPSKVSIPENERVRALYLVHLEARARHWVNGDPNPDAYGHARKEFARAWVALAEQLGLHVPGGDMRTPLAPGQDANERRVDAAHTNLRQFQEGKNQYAWMLVGIEAVVCDREGRALPGAAYQGQGQLPV